jgi:hypothetical protein
MTLRTEPSDRDVRILQEGVGELSAVRSWRQNSFGCFSRRPWNTLRNCMCGVACCRKEWGEAFSNIFTTDTKSWSIPDWGSSNTCDIYMCRLRHINDPVLSSLKMEGIRLFILIYIYMSWYIYLLTAISLIPTVAAVQYTFTYKQYTEQHNWHKQYTEKHN